MKVNDNLSILILPEKPEMNTNGEAPIYIRITVCGQRKELTLGARIKPEKWDYENEKPKGISPADLKINSLITAARAKLENLYIVLYAQYQYVTADMLK